MKPYLGYIYALLAAIFNGMIGIFSVKIMSVGLSPYAIAFYKCLIAFLIITSWLIVSKQLGHWINYIKRLWWQLLVASLFGFFVLYFFETAAYKYEKVTIVVFMLLGSAVITTFILSSVLDKKWLSLHDVMSCAFALFGLALIFGVNVGLSNNYLGIFLALIAGMGYGAFLTISPRFNIGSGLLVVNSLMLFGMLYLFIPFAHEGLVFITDTHTVILLTLLALLPTIGGFLCTTKALTLLKSESVQLIELSEPIFSLVFSFVFLNQYITFWQVTGGSFLIISIYVNIASPAKASAQSTQNVSSSS
jgi:drug/metabolite transporter (DMT)-like permease